MTAINWQWFVAPGSALYLLPLALLAGIAILARGTGGRAVLVWWAAILLACVLTAASKISFFGWGTGIRAWDLTCFSGHTVISFCVWPVVGMLLPSPSSRVLRVLGLLAGISLATVIGYSRIPLGAHPVSEVIAGLLLGALAGGDRRLGTSAREPSRVVRSRGRPAPAGYDDSSDGPSAHPAQ